MKLTLREKNNILLPKLRKVEHTNFHNFQDCHLFLPYIFQIKIDGFLENTASSLLLKYSLAHLPNCEEGKKNKINLANSRRM